MEQKEASQLQCLDFSFELRLLFYTYSQSKKHLSETETVLWHSDILFYILLELFSCFISLVVESGPLWHFYFCIPVV